MCGGVVWPVGRRSRRSSGRRSRGADERRARWLRTRVGRGQLVGSAALAGQIAVIGAAAVASRWRWSLRRLWVAAMSFHSAAAAWKPRRVKERIPLPVLI